MDEATKLLATEPEHPKSHVTFTQLPNEKERQRLTLPKMLGVYPKWLFAGSALVIIISLTLQAGPLLTEYAIKDGMEPGHHDLALDRLLRARLPGPRLRERATSSASRSTSRASSPHGSCTTCASASSPSSSD